MLDPFGEIKNIIEKSSITDVKMDFFQRVKYKQDDYEGNKYDNVVIIFDALYRELSKTNTEKNKALRMVLSTHDKMIRFAIMEEMAKLFGDKNPDYLNLTLILEDLKRQTVEVADSLSKIKSEIAIIATQKEMHQYIAYLQYAAYVYGDSEEKSVVDGLIKKIEKAKRKSNGLAKTKK